MMINSFKSKCLSMNTIFRCMAFYASLNSKWLNEVHPYWSLFFGSYKVLITQIDVKKRKLKGYYYNQLYKIFVSYKSFYNVNYVITFLLLSHRALCISSHCSVVPLQWSRLNTLFTLKFNFFSSSFFLSFFWMPACSSFLWYLLFP